MFSKSIKPIIQTILIGTLSSVSGNALALGLYIPYQSAADMGDGRAGSAAVVRDASTNYFNPAGLVRFDHMQFVASEIGVTAHYTFTGQMFNPGLGVPTHEVGTASTTPNGLVPAFHIVVPLSKKWSLGASLIIPNGLGYEYGPQSIVRYNAWTAIASSASLSPSLAYRINPQFSVGFGPDFLYSLAKVKVLVDTRPFSLADSESKERLTGLDYGWHAGILYEMSPQTRIGLAFHSRVITHLYGQSVFYSSGFLPRRTISNNLRTIVPYASLSTLSVYHEVTPCLAVEGSMEFMNWNTYKFDRAKNVASPAGPPLDVTIYRGLRNTYYYALGGSYKLTENWLLRGGLAYARGSGKNAYRQITLTDGNQVALSLGVHNQTTKTIGLDIGLNTASIQTTTINTVNQSTGAVLSGRYPGTGSALGAQLTWDIV